VGLFRRRKPLHEQLAEAGGIVLDAEAGAGGAFSVHPPGWDGGSPLSEPAFHGIARPRRWDVIATAEAPRLRGETVHFVALPDGTLVIDEDEPDDALDPLADAVEASVAAPYRAEGVRRGPAVWAVAASRIAIVAAPGLEGDEIELTSTGGGRTLLVDGRPTAGSARALERLGEAEGRDYVVRARRIDGDLFDVEATPL
jgi:hypothetical protein